MLLEHCAVGCDSGTVRIGIVLGAVKLDPEAVDHRAQGGRRLYP